MMQALRTLPAAATVAARSFSSSAAAKTNVGFIGLGNMGAHMARNLVKAKHSIVVLDQNAALKDEFQRIGQWADSPQDIAKQADVVITMLPASQHVSEVFLGAKGLLKGAKPGTLFIDSSTIDPAVAKSVATEVKKAGSKFCDAPVSGGVGGAQAGTLTFMVGADKKDFEDAKKILQSMGKNVVHCGDVGTGQVAKICNNMLLAISMIGVSETMNLGVRLGIDPKLLAGILNTSTGRCWSSDTYNPCPGVMEGVPSSRDYTGGFGSALMLKDLGLAMNAASSTKTSVPLGSLANQVYSLMCSKGFANKDFSSAYKFLAEQTKA